MTRHSLVRSFPVLLLTLGLSACPAPTSPPVAVIAMPGARSPMPADGGTMTGDCTALSGPVTTHPGQAPHLGGGCSTDPQGLPLTYHWALASSPNGSLAQIHDPAQMDPTFIPDVPGTYTVRLVVSNGLLTGMDEIDVTVDGCGLADPALMASATPTDPAVGHTVALAVTVNDPDTATGCAAHAPVFTYAWQVESAPAGSTAVPSDPASSAPSITPDVPGDYVVRVTVTDPTGHWASTTATFTAGMCGSNAPTGTALVTTPSTIVGVGVQFQVTMDDADNNAPCMENQILTPHWRLVEVPAGSLAQILPADAERPSLTPDVAGQYIAEVVVTDSTGRTSRPSRATLDASPCGTAEPVAVAQVATGLAGGVVSTNLVTCSAGPVSINLGGVANEILLDAVSSSDPDNAAPCSLDQTLYYRWSLLVAPLGGPGFGGGGGGISLPTGRTATLDAQVAGQYQVRLEVLDDTGRVSRDDICTITVSNPG